jgi:hypothetical protein
LAALPNPIATAAPIAIARGRVGSIRAVAASLLTRRIAAGIMKELSKAAPLPALGGGRKRDPTRLVT